MGRPQETSIWIGVILPKVNEGYTMIPNWIFDDMRYIGLSDRGKALLPYLIAGHGAGRSKFFLPPGFHKGNFARFAADMGWEQAELDCVLAELEEAGWILTDESNGLVLIPAVTTRADNPSDLIGTARKVAKLPESNLRQQYFELMLDITLREPRTWETPEKKVLEQIERELPPGLDLPEWCCDTSITSQDGSPET